MESAACIVVGTWLVGVTFHDRLHQQDKAGECQQQVLMKGAQRHATIP